MWLFALFVLLPIIEIGLFIQIGGWLGLWPTLGLVVLSAILGASLMRAQGAKALWDVQQSFRTLNDPTRPLAHGALILLAGALMVTPGFATDSMGLALLVPKIRDAVLRRLSGHITVMGAGFGPRPQHGPGGAMRPDHDVIDGDYTPADPAQGQTPPRGPSGWTRDPSSD